MALEEQLGDEEEELFPCGLGDVVGGASGTDFTHAADGMQGVRADVDEVESGQGMQQTEQRVGDGCLRAELGWRRHVALDLGREREVAGVERRK